MSFFTLLQDKELKDYKQRNFKSRKRTLSGDRSYYVEYARYELLGRTYEQAELDGSVEIRIYEMLASLGADEIKSLADLYRLNIFGFIREAMNRGYLWEFLSIVLTRVDSSISPSVSSNPLGKGVGESPDSPGESLLPITPDEFKELPMRLFAPFFRQVVTDFFYLRSDVFQPMRESIRKGFDVLQIIRDAAAVVQQSIPHSPNSTSSAEATPPD